MQHEAGRITYQVIFPGDTPKQALLDFVRALSGLPRPRLFRHVQTVVLDTYRDSLGFRWFITVPNGVSDELKELLRAHVGGARLDLAEDDPVSGTAWEVARQLRTTGVHLPFNIYDADAACTTILSKFSPVEKDQALVMQWVVIPGRTAGPVPPPGTWAKFSVDEKKYKDKNTEPRFMGVVRIAATGPKAREAVKRVYSGLSTYRAEGMGFADYPLTWHVSSRVRKRSGALVYEAHLNAAELAAFSGIPTGSPNVPGLPHARTRQLRADPRYPTQGIIVGRSTYAGDERPIALNPIDLAQHVHIQGKTGTGKSVLTTAMALQQMEQGYGVGIIDPTGDLIADILPLIPPHRARDVILFSPVDTEFPVGFNIFAGTDSPEVLADQVMAIFRGIYKDTGIYANNYLRAAIQTLATVPGMTLCELPALLTDDRFRAETLRQVSELALLYFWQRFDAMGRGERANAVAPALHRVQPLLLRRSVRLTLGQSTSSLDMARIIREGKILLCDLPKGLLGDETAVLFASLIFAKGWQAAMAIPRDDRKPWFLHIDEASNFLNMPMPLETVLSEARKYGYALTLIHQYDYQLPPQLRAALDIVRTQIYFQISPDDARVVAKNMAPHLDAHDAAALSKHEILLQATVNGTTLPPATVDTSIPWPMPPRASSEALRAFSQRQWGRLASAVEAEIAHRLRPIAPSEPRTEAGPQGREEIT